MSDFDRTLSKAIAEIAAARHMGPEHASGFLKQARFHVCLALYQAERAAAVRPEETKFAMLVKNNEGSN